MKPHPPDDEGTIVEHPTPNAVLLVRLAAILTGALGLIVLSGWAFDMSLLRSVLPGAVLPRRGVSPSKTQFRQAVDTCWNAAT